MDFGDDDDDDDVTRGVKKHLRKSVFPPTAQKFVRDNNHHKRRRLDSSKHDVGHVLVREECEAVKDLYFNNPAVRMGSQAFKSKLFEHPFEIYYGSGLADRYYPIRDPLRHRLIKEYWIPFLRDVYDQLKMFGICPFYYKKIQTPSNDDDDDEGDKKDGSREGRRQRQLVVHLVPIVPPLDSGAIWTFMSGKEQRFYWRWNYDIELSSNGGRKKTTTTTFSTVDEQEDGSVYFVVKDAPSLFGNLRSALSALIKDHVQTELARENEAMAAMAAANPLSVIEYAPPLKEASEGIYSGQRNPRESRPITEIGAAWAGGPDYSEPESMTRLESINNIRRHSLVDDARVLGPRTPLGDLGLQDIYGSAVPSWYGTGGGDRGSILNSERFDALNNIRRLRGAARALDGSREFHDLTREERALLANTSNTMILAPYERYVAAAQSKADSQHVQRLIERMDRLSSAAVDFPLTLVSDKGGGGSGTTASGGVNASLRFFEDRLKAETTYYAEVIKETFAVAYAAAIGKAKRNARTILSRNRVDGSYDRYQKLKRIADDAGIKVIFPRMPLRNLEELINLYRHRMIDEETTYKFVMDHIGLNSDVVEYPKDYKITMQSLYPNRPSATTTTANTLSTPDEEEEGEES